ncbi:MAG: hypothetical protein ACE5O2_01440 [Armatimonadota bacterium]
MAILSASGEPMGLAVGARGGGAAPYPGGGGGSTGWLGANVACGGGVVGGSRAPSDEVPGRGASARIGVEHFQHLDSVL